MTYKIGITGSIGSGKTTIAKCFSFFNIPVYDADLEVKHLLKEKLVIKQIKQKWPTTVSNNQLNKKKLKSIVFSNDIDKKFLENLLHPILKKRKERFEKENKGKNILIFDVPLLYETNSEKNYSLVILANCDLDIQRERVLLRDKISSKLFYDILSKQMSVEEKLKFKPKLINTNKLRFLIYLEIIILLVQIYIGFMRR